MMSRVNEFVSSHSHYDLRLMNKYVQYLTYEDTNVQAGMMVAESLASIGSSNAFILNNKNWIKKAENWTKFNIISSFALVGDWWMMNDEWWIETSICRWKGYWYFTRLLGKSAGWREGRSTLWLFHLFHGSGTNKRDPSLVGGTCQPRPSFLYASSIAWEPEWNAGTCQCTWSWIDLLWNVRPRIDRWIV